MKRGARLGRVLRSTAGKRSVPFLRRMLDRLSAARATLSGASESGSQRPKRAEEQAPGLEPFGPESPHEPVELVRGRRVFPIPKPANKPDE